MSGGLWNYKNELKENYRSMKVSKVVDALIRVFHEIDWAESWDTDREYAEPIVYDIMLELGDELFGERVTV